MAGLSVSAMRLRGNASKAAEELDDTCPKIIFTSGRRDLVEQARAMAGNVNKKSDWIAKTYKASKASKTCQEWVDDHPDAKLREIEDGLYQVLKGLGDSETARISRHLSGQAFDIQPNSADLKTVKSVVAKYKGKFLDHEGGLCRWHAQFDG